MIFTGRVERWRQVYVPNPAMLRLQLVQQGYEPFQWNERLGTYYGWHFHDEEQVHWIIRGELEITVQSFGRTFTYTLKAGDRDFMPPRQYHTARVIGETDLLYLIGIKKAVEAPVEEVEEVKAAPKARKTRAKSAAKPKTTKAKTTKTKPAAKTKKKK